MPTSICPATPALAKAPKDNNVWPIYNIAACLEFVWALERTPFSRADIPQAEVSSADPVGLSRWYFMRRSLLAYKLAVEVGDDTYALTELAATIKAAPVPTAEVRRAARKAAKSPAIFAELARAFPDEAWRPRDKVQEALEAAGYNKTLARWAALNWEKSRDFVAGREVPVIRRNRPGEAAPAAVPMGDEADEANGVSLDEWEMPHSLPAGSPFRFLSAAWGDHLVGDFNVRTKKQAKIFMEEFAKVTEMMALPDGES